MGVLLGVSVSEFFCSVIYSVGQYLVIHFTTHTVARSGAKEYGNGAHWS